MDSWIVFLIGFCIGILFLFGVVALVAVRDKDKSNRDSEFDIRIRALEEFAKAYGRSQEGDKYNDIYELTAELNRYGDNMQAYHGRSIRERQEDTQ